MKWIVGVDLNVVIGLLWFGFWVGWMSWVGCDLFGCYVFDMLVCEGIDVLCVIVDLCYLIGF